MAAKDFGGVIIALILIIAIYALNRKKKKLTTGDFIFISVAVLIAVELIWLNVSTHIGNA
jgi:hypothetical protein